MLSNASRKRRLVVMFVLTFIYMIAELVVGYVGKSTTLLTDAFHMLSDVIALVIGFISIHLSPKKWEQNTFGWARMEVLGALVNAVFLLALCFTIVMDSIQKLVHPECLKESLLVLCVGAGGLLMNLIGLCVFREPKDKEVLPVESVASQRKGSLIQNQNRLTRIIVPKITPSMLPVSDANSPKENCSAEDPNSIKVESNDKTEVETVQPNIAPEGPFAPPMKRQDVNMRSVFLHLLADTANSVVVVLAAGATYAVEEYIGKNYNTIDKWSWVVYLDPVLSLIIVSLICCSTWPLIQETSMILLQTVPSHVSMKVLTEELLVEVKGISGIHEFHVWQLAGDKFYASIHVKCATLADYERIANEIKAFFNRRGIFETTIQAEIKASDKEGRGSDSCLVSPVNNGVYSSPSLNDPKPTT